MKKLALKIVLFSVPLWLLILSFFVLDPFKIVYKYDNLSEYYKMDLNRDFVATEVFKHNNPKLHYNSFIFGSSRTLAFHTSSWKKHLDKDAVPFLFNASNEGLYGISSKLKFLRSHNVKVKNALILIDAEVLHFVRNVSEAITIKHYEVSQESKLDFFWLHLKKYISKFFWFDYLKAELFGGIYPNYTGDNVKYDSITNDWYMFGWENQIKSNPSDYYNARMNDFLRHADSVKLVYDSICIKDIQKEKLLEISQLLKTQNIDYKIVISPMYHQRKFNQNDLSFIIDVFGENRVYDFSGINDLTSYRQNYYEGRHFRPIVGDSIMARIYRKDANGSK